MKTCTKCQETKDATAFGRKADNHDGLQSWCRTCFKAYGKVYRPRYYAEHTDEIKAYQRAQYEADPERVTRWREAQPEKYRAAANAHHAKRRVARRSAVPPWADLAAIAEVYAFATEMRAGGIDCHVDHVIPLLGKKVCGLHVHTNLAVILADKNRRKGNRWVDENPLTISGFMRSSPRAQSTPQPPALPADHP